MSKTAEKLAVTTAVVFRVLKSYKIAAHTNKMTADLQKQVVKDYLEGQSTSPIAEKYGVSVKTICDILKKHNIKRNNRYSNLRLDVNYWENIDTPDKAYFLGFMITDGCVYSHRNVTLALTERDKHILETFKKYTGNEVKIHTQNKIAKGKKNNECVFNVSCAKWVEDLSKFGVAPRKTSTVDMPKLDDALMSHLIRGMIDGDGWITGGHVIGFCGNEQCVTSVRNYLVQRLGVFNVKVGQQGPNLWQAIWGSKKDFKTICDFIYKDKRDLYLIRKYDKVHINPEVTDECKNSQHRNA